MHKATERRKLCCNILKHKSCYQSIQGQHPVFLTHGSDSLGAAPIGPVPCFTEWLLNHTWSPAFTHPNRLCKQRSLFVCPVTQPACTIACLLTLLPFRNSLFPKSDTGKEIKCIPFHRMKLLSVKWEDHLNMQTLGACTLTQRAEASG